MPVAVGAAATAGWVVDLRGGLASCSTSAPASSPLVIRDMVVTVLLNALLALPVFTRLVRRVLRPVAGGDPLELAPPPASAAPRPARSGCAGWRSSRDVPRQRQAPALTPQLALRVRRSSAAIALVAVRDHLLPPLVPPGAVRRPLPGRGERQPRARDQGAGAARRDRRPQRPHAGGQPAGARGEDHAPTSCPRTRAERAGSTGGSAGCSRCARARSRTAVEPAAEGAAVLHGRPSSRTCPTSSPEYLARAPGRTSRGVDVERVFLRQYPHKRSARTCSARSAR